MRRAHRANFHRHAHRRRGHLPGHEEDIVLALLGGGGAGLEEPEDPPRPGAHDLLVEATRATHLDARAGLLRPRPDHRVPELLLVAVDALLTVDLEDHVADDRAHGLEVHLELDVRLGALFLLAVRGRPQGLGDLVGAVKARVHQRPERGERLGRLRSRLEVRLRDEVVVHLGVERLEVLVVEPPEHAALRLEEGHRVLERGVARRRQVERIAILDLVAVVRPHEHLPQAAGRAAGVTDDRLVRLLERVHEQRRHELLAGLIHLEQRALRHLDGVLELLGRLLGVGVRRPVLDVAHLAGEILELADVVAHLHRRRLLRHLALLGLGRGRRHGEAHHRAEPLRHRIDARPLDAAGEQLVEAHAGLALGAALRAQADLIEHAAVGEERRLGLVLLGDLVELRVVGEGAEQALVRPVGRGEHLELRDGVAVVVGDLHVDVAEEVDPLRDVLRVVVLANAVQALLDAIALLLFLGGERHDPLLALEELGALFE